MEPVVSVVVTSAVIVAIMFVPLAMISFVVSAFSSKPAPGQPLKPKRHGCLFPILLLGWLVVPPSVLLFVMNPNLPVDKQVDVILINTAFVNTVWLAFLTLRGKRSAQDEAETDPRKEDS